MKITDYIKKLEENYIDGVLYKQTSKSSSQKNLCVQLIDFFDNFDELKTPFGEIFSIEKIIEMSDREPFKSENYICFGKDNYFSYWICKKDVKEGEDCFSIWDHETSFDEVEPCFSELTELLEFAENEYNDSEEDICDVIIKSSDSQSLSELMKIKKLFSSSLSIGEIKNQVNNGSCIIKEGINLYRAKKILSENNFEHIKVELSSDIQSF